MVNSPKIEERKPEPIPEPVKEKKPKDKEPWKKLDVPHKVKISVHPH
jgi:hypothetical protein